MLKTGHEVNCALAAFVRKDLKITWPRGETPTHWRALGVEIMIVECRSDRDFEAALEKMVRGGAEALILDTFAFSNLDKVVSLAALHKMPAMYPSRQLARAGGLMSYDADR
jgi:hypothetical protein